MDNSPKDSSRKSPDRDRQGRRRSQREDDPGDHEAGEPPPIERPEQHPVSDAAPESSTAVSRTASETPAAAQERQSSSTRMPLEVVGSDGSGQRSRGPKRSRVSDEKAGPSGAKPRKKPQEFDAPAVASPCSVCGRRFGSWKALFGHMRSHPERDWRGIHPPPKFNREGTPEGPDDVYQEDAENVMIRQQADNLLLGVAQDVAARLGTAATAETAGFTSPIVTTVSEGSKTESNINHRCNICLQVFSSGQDLGEHVLSHYSDRQFQAASSSSTPQRRRGLSIDLNFPNEPDAELTSSPPPPSERKEGGFDLNRQPSPGDEEK